jgi:hypothetical protein
MTTTCRHGNNPDTCRYQSCIRSTNQGATMTTTTTRITAGNIVRFTHEGKAATGYVTSKDDGEGNLRVNLKTGVYVSVNPTLVQVVGA